MLTNGVYMETLGKAGVLFHCFQRSARSPSRRTLIKPPDRHDSEASISALLDCYLGDGIPRWNSAMTGASHEDIEPVIQSNLYTLDSIWEVCNVAHIRQQLRPDEMY
jgi:hypothetical protein